MNLFKMSLFGSIIILAILVIRLIAKDRLPKKLLWALWLIAIFKLIIPFEIPFEYSIYSLLESGFQELGMIQRNSQSDFKGENGVDFFELSLLEEFSKLTFQREERETLKDLKSKEMMKSNEADQKQGFEHANNSNPEHIIYSNSLNTQKGISKKGLNQASEGSSNRIKIGNPVFILWLLGFAIGAFVYLKLYVSYYRTFNGSEEVKDEFVLTWLEEHPILRKIKVKSAEFLTSPMTYGIFKPVILLPKDMESISQEDLEYILYHEYTHIRRFDALTKSVLCFVSCVHWFNPLVWVMYFMFNRDIELICDEAVILNFGHESRSPYAHSLLDLQEHVHSFHPNIVLCSNFNKNAIEERIVSIMKTKKYNKITSLMVILIIVFFAGCFATTKNMEQGDNQKSVDEKKSEMQHSQNDDKKRDVSSNSNESKKSDEAQNSDDTPKYHFVRYLTTYYNANQFSRETLEWLDKVAYFSFEEMMMLSSTPKEIIKLENGRREAKTSDKEENRPISSQFEKMFTEEELNKIKEFTQDKSHMDKSVAELQKEIFEKFSEEELLTILRMSNVSGFIATEENEQTLYFMENVFLPVIADKWKRIQFESFVDIKEFNKWLETYFQADILYKINNIQKLNVRDMVQRKEGLGKELNQFLKTKKNFSYEDVYKKDSEFVHEIKQIENTWSDDILSFKVLLNGSKLHYVIVYEAQRAEQQDKQQVIQQDKQKVTGKDIKSLLTLKPANDELLLKDFHALVNKWKSEDPDRAKRVMDLVHSESGLDVDYKFLDGDIEFILKTILLSDVEVSRSVSSTNTKVRMFDNALYRHLAPAVGNTDYPAFTFAFEYSLNDFEHITLKEREDAIFGFVKAFEAYCLEMSFEEYAKLTKEKIFQKYKELAQKYSSEKISIIVDERDIKFFER